MDGKVKGVIYMANIRKEMLDIALEAKDYHLAPSLSCIDILTAIYDKVMTENDKFILSKGHACIALYAILRRKGFKPDVYKGHPDIDVENGIECTTGSLGHGLPVAVGMALAKKLKKEEGRIFVLMSDGECQEGTTWESLMIASHHKLDNLIVIIDYNKIQSLDYIANVLDISPLVDKIKSFGCQYHITDGHSVYAIQSRIQSQYIKAYKPIVIIANTTKGKGISFMENKPEWHARLPNDEELKQAVKELK